MRTKHSLRVVAPTLAVLLMVLNACNRPAQEPSPDSVATSVAATLTAQALAQPTSLQTAVSESSGGEVDEPTLEPTVEGPASAEPSTVESSSVEPQATEGATATLESPPTPTFTAVPLDPDDPRSGLNLSDPDYSDDFSDARWFLYSDEDAAFALEDGRLRASNNKTDGVLWWTTTALEVGDVYAEITAETTSCSEKDAYGMGLRVGGDNIDRGYTLEISCDGSYRLRKFIAFDEIPERLRDWTPSELIESGPEASNAIGFLVNADQLFVYVNGELISNIPVEDADYASGIPSLFANASKTSNLTVYFDDFRLWFFNP